jgi:hypothetical protein
VHCFVSKQQPAEQGLHLPSDTNTSMHAYAHWLYLHLHLPYAPQLFMLACPTSSSLSLNTCLTHILAAAAAVAAVISSACCLCLQVQVCPVSVRAVRPVLVRAGGDLGDQAGQAARDAQKNVSDCCLR